MAGGAYPDGAPWAGGYPTDATPKEWTGPKTHETLWLGEYARLRNSFDPNNPEAQKAAHQAATEFYRAHRQEMDAGAVVTWEHCYDAETELSAVQHAYNALIDDGPEVFSSEYQNAPQPKTEASGLDLKPEGVIAKAVRIARGTAPAYATTVTAYIDVHDSILYWAAVAIVDGFRAHVMDYGTFPDQHRAYFEHKAAKATLRRAYPGTDKTSALRAGLVALTDQLAERRWPRETGGQLSTSLVLVDASDGDHADIVYEVCRQSKYAANLRPSKGQYFGAASKPFEQYEKREGESLGLHWRIAPLPNKKAVHLAHPDTNWWKSFTQARWLTPIGQAGSLELFGSGDFRQDSETHRLLADHVTAEYGTTTEGRGRKLTEWKLIVGRDNHYLDTIVNALVAASILKVSPPWQHQAAAVIRRKPRSTPRVTYI